MLLLDDFITMLVENAGETIIHLTKVIWVLFCADVSNNGQIFLALCIVFKICTFNLMSVFSPKNVSYVYGAETMTKQILFLLLILIISNESDRLDIYKRLRLEIPYVCWQSLSPLHVMVHHKILVFR